MVSEISGLDLYSLSTTQGERYPHWECNNAIYHVVFRLYDSIPLSLMNSLKEEKKTLDIIKHNRKLIGQEIGKIRLFEKFDKAMASNSRNPLLTNCQIAQFITDMMKAEHGDKYNLHAYCVMPNHVHAIVEPLSRYELSKIVVYWKGSSAHKINKLLDRTGHVWAKDYFNHIIRSGTSYDSQVLYVKNNPIAAGLNNWPWVGSCL